MVEELLVGTCGWDHDAWVGEYYPADLPRDWRLSYYCTGLRSVLVPEASWVGVTPADTAVWAEDSYPEFRFVLALPAELASPQPFSVAEQRLHEFLKLIAPIRSQVAGLLVTLGPEASAVEAWLREMVPLVKRHYRLCADLADPLRGQADITEALARQGIGLCWRAEVQASPAGGGEFLVALSREHEPGAQRRLIEALDRWMGEARGAALFFDGPRAGVNASQARTIAELLGV